MPYIRRVFTAELERNTFEAFGEYRFLGYQTACCDAAREAYEVNVWIGDRVCGELRISAVTFGGV